MLTPIIETIFNYMLLNTYLNIIYITYIVIQYNYNIVNIIYIIYIF